MDKLICIIGPTAVGKTELSINLAKKLNTEIVSGDSMLVYRKLDIGTAKPSLEERQGIPHHLIDFLDAHEDFSAAKFNEVAHNIIHDINKKGKIPILAGGTGLYVKSLLEGYDFSPAPKSQALREKLELLAKEKGNLYLYEMLKKMCPRTAERLHPNDIRRVVRAIEVYHLKGQEARQAKSYDIENKLRYDCLVIGLTMDRQRLYERINLRVDKMIRNGLVDEVKNLLNEGLSTNCQAMQAIGYKEIVAYLNGQCTFIDAVNNIKQATRNFAKRQFTWYRKMPYIKWYDVEKNSADKILEYIYRDVAEKFFSM